MLTLLPDKLTPLSLEEAIEAFADGWSVALGWDPKARQLAVLVAHTVLECGDGFKSLHHYNFGNEKASPGYQGYYCMYRCNEVIGGKVYWFDPPHPQTWFRAFMSARDGAVEHVKFLAVDTSGDGHNRYQAAWNMVLSGDADGFVKALKSAGYFTGNVDAYSKAVSSIANKIGPACDRILNSEHHGITDEDREHVTQSVGLWLAEQAGQFGPEPMRLA